MTLVGIKRAEDEKIDVIRKHYNNDNNDIVNINQISDNNDGGRLLHTLEDDAYFLLESKVIAEDDFLKLKYMETNKFILKVDSNSNNSNNSDNSDDKNKSREESDEISANGGLSDVSLDISETGITGNSNNNNNRIEEI